YVGRDVESMIRDLVDISINLVRADREYEVQDVAEARVVERLLDLLLPATNPDPEKPAGEGAAGGSGEVTGVFVAGPGGVEPREGENLQERRKRTRDKLRKLLEDG